jgi:hypothetical protein
MKPYYHDASRLIKQVEDFKSETPISFAKVDGSVESTLVKRNDVVKYPTLIMFRKHNGTKHQYEYEGPRQKSGGLFLSENNNFYIRIGLHLY